MSFSTRPAAWVVARPLAYLCCLFLSACALLQRPAEIPPRPAREAVSAFSLEGRLAVRQGDRPAQAGIEWEHRPGWDRVFLTGPLGQGLAELEQTADGARMTTADQKRFTAPDASRLARDLLGFELPLERLPEVVVGQVDTQTRDALGRPERALSAGWQVRYLRYESDDPRALPSLIELHRDRQGDDEALELRLKIDQWNLPHATP